MIRSTAFCLIISFLAVSSHAGEITIEARPFFVKKSFSATVLPEGGCVIFQTIPKAWTDFKIIQLAAHGSMVSKDDVLVKFETKDIDRKLIDARRALAISKLRVAQADLELKSLIESSPHKLENARLAAQIAKEENTYFNTTRRKASQEAADQKLEAKKQALSNENEELKQLAAMYKADDITENTEEIILTRQKDAVASAEFSLRMETLDHKRILEVTLPREAVTLANAQRDTSIALAKEEIEIPLAIELKKLEVEGLKNSNQIEKDGLNDLEQDRKLFEIKAPADGCFFYGSIENGRWLSNPELIKSMVPYGRPPMNRPFATLVPHTAKLSLVAFLDEMTARALKLEMMGIATLASREDVEIPIKIKGLSAIPTVEGNYRADLSAVWPNDLLPFTGSTVQTHVIAYQKELAIFIPSKTLTYGPQGWTVDVKLTEGKPEKRPVKRGRVSGDDTEILSGLELGQVIVGPS